MTVHFIGAGPGAADLITVRGRDLIARCPVCLYAGSIVPRDLLSFCPAGARIIDTAPLSLDEIEAEFKKGSGDQRAIKNAAQPNKIGEMKCYAVERLRGKPGNL